MNTRKVAIITTAIFCLCLIALTASADETYLGTINQFQTVAEFQMFQNPEFDKMKQGDFFVLRAEEPFFSNAPFTLGDEVEVDSISGPIANFGEHPVMVMLLVGSPYSSQPDKLQQTVFARLLMPGQAVNISKMVSDKGLDILSSNLADAARGEEVHSILMFISAGPIDGYFPGVEFTATFTH